MKKQLMIIVACLAVVGVQAANYTSSWEGVEIDAALDDATGAVSRVSDNWSSVSNAAVSAVPDATVSSAAVGMESSGEPLCFIDLNEAASGQTDLSSAGNMTFTAPGGFVFNFSGGYLLAPASTNANSTDVMNVTGNDGRYLYATGTTNKTLIDAAIQSATNGLSGGGGTFDIIVDGNTNTPSGGSVDITASFGSAAYSNANAFAEPITNTYTVSNLSTPVRDLDMEERVGIPCPNFFDVSTTYDACTEVGSLVYGKKFNAVNDRGVYSVPKGTYNVVVRGRFNTNAVDHTYGASVALSWYSIDPATDARTGGTDQNYLVSTQGYFTVEKTISTPDAWSNNYASALHVVAGAGSGVATNFGTFFVFDVEAFPTNNTMDTLGTLIKDMQDDW